MGTITEQKDEIRPDGGQEDNTSEDSGSESSNTQTDDRGLMEYGKGILGDTRERLRNLTPDTARERTERERSASRVVQGKRAKHNTSENPEPNVSTLQSKAKNHKDKAEEANKVVEDLIQDENEGLSQTADSLENDLEEFADYGQQELPENLEWSYDPHRSVTTTRGEEVDDLFSYLANKSVELDDIFEKITAVNDNIQGLKDKRKEVVDELKQKEDEVYEQEERVSHEKRTEMTPSEAREADIDDITDFADDVGESKGAHVEDQREELKEKRKKLDRKISRAEGVESASYEVRNEIEDEIEAAYEPHAEEMESMIHDLSAEVEEGIEYLEGLAEVDLPNLTEESGTKYVDDAAPGLQRTRKAAADSIVERVGELSGYLANIEQEHEDLRDLLPTHYVEDGEFGRIDIADEVLTGVSDELSGSYDTVVDRISSAYEEATGDNFHEAIDDADGTIDHLRASYSNEVRE